MRWLGLVLLGSGTVGLLDLFCGGGDSSALASIRTLASMKSESSLVHGHVPTLAHPCLLHHLDNVVSTTNSLPLSSTHPWRDTRPWSAERELLLFVFRSKFPRSTKMMQCDTEPRHGVGSAMRDGQAGMGGREREPHPHAATMSTTLLTSRVSERWPECSCCTRGHRSRGASQICAQEDARMNRAMKKRLKALVVGGGVWHTTIQRKHHMPIHAHHAVGRLRTPQIIA